MTLNGRASRRHQRLRCRTAGFLPVLDVLQLVDVSSAGVSMFAKRRREQAWQMSWRRLAAADAKREPYPVLLNADDYRIAAGVRIATARMWYDLRRYGASGYLVGVAVECILRAYRLRLDPHKVTIDSSVRFSSALGVETASLFMR
jgi:hypothetical protein